MKLRVENTLTRNKLVCSLLKRMRFLILELHFEIFFQQFQVFSSILGFQYELLPYLAQKFRHSRQKCILRVQTKNWWKIGFRLESVTVSNKIRSLTKICWTFGEKFRHVRQGSVFPIRGLVLKKKQLFQKKHVSFIIMGLRVESKTKMTFDSILSALLSKLYSESPEQQFDFSWTIFILLSFWDPNRNCWDLLRKKFGTFVETAFYIYRQTIWRETNFSKEYSSAYLFVTWRGM